MKKIHEKSTIEKYLKASHLPEHFCTENLDFFLIEYRRGEFLSRPGQAVTNFLFPVRGNTVLYYLDENGNKRTLALLGGTGLLGDMEFALNSIPIFYAEAVTPVTALALPMERNRSALEKDCRFLMFLLRQNSQNKISIARNTVVLPKLDERLIYYLKNDCPGQTMIGMDHTAARLRCSRRQLQRVVKKLKEQGRLIRVRKGSYRLTEKEPEA